MRRATQEEYKVEVLKVLERIHDVCVCHGIRYAIAYGTLLGAVRHKGFIPWDDDVDIVLPREDYPLFRKYFPKEDGSYYVLDSDVSPYYYNNFPRACSNSMVLKLTGVNNIDGLGPFVDLFLMDEWPSDEEETRLYRAEIREAYRNVIYALPSRSLMTHTMKSRIGMYLHPWMLIKNRFFVGLEKRQEEKRLILTKYEGKGTGRRMVSFERVLEPDDFFVSEEQMGERFLIPFENLQVYAPAYYKEMLESFYGDYMTLPPEEQRISKHHFIPYWQND